jgi:hypothetical protein
MTNSGSYVTFAPRTVIKTKPQRYSDENDDRRTVSWRNEIKSWLIKSGHGHASRTQLSLYLNSAHQDLLEALIAILSQTFKKLLKFF